MKIKIIQFCDEIELRPRFNHEIIKYFEKFVYDEIILNNNRLLNSKWTIQLALYYSPQMDNRNKFGKIEYEIVNPHVARNVKLKSYTIFIPFNIKNYNEYNKIELIVNVIFNALRAFFITIYKSYNEIFFDQLWNKIDFEYLMSFKYPADFKDQQFEGDNKSYIKDVYKIFYEDNR